MSFRLRAFRAEAYERRIKELRAKASPEFRDFHDQSAT